MKTLLKAVTLSILPLMAATLPAATIVSLTSNAGTSFRVGGPVSQVETMSWTQTASYAGVNISAMIGSIDGSSQTVLAYLTNAIGPAAGAPIASTSIIVPSFSSEGAITSASLFSGLTLGPGSYYLTLFNTDTTGNVNLRWARATSIVFGSGSSANGEFFTNTTGNGTPNTANPWQSAFISSALYDNAFTVTGNLVPEPATFGLGGAALLLVILGSRKRAA